MPNTTLTINSELLSTTLHAAAKEIRDQLDYSLPLLAHMEKAGKMSIDGGTLYEEPLNFSEHSSTTQLTTGYEPINMVITEVGTPAVDTWADAIRPVVISQHEQRINRGSGHKLIDIADERGKATMAAFRRELDRRLHGLVPNPLTDINTFNGDDFADGFLENVATGAQNNIVHGVNKGTYLTQPGWQNQRVDAANSFSANGLIALDQAMTRVLSIKTVSPKKFIWLASVSAFGHLKRAVRTNERYVSEGDLDAGRLSLAWNGYKVEADRNMPNAGAVTVGAVWSFAGIDFEECRFIANGSDYFRTGEFVLQSGYDVLAAPIHLMGQLRTKYLGSSALITRADTW